MASEEKCVCTACPGWGDHEYCVIKTIVKDGKIDHTEKMRYTGVEADEGYICQKGLMSWRQAYDKTRLLHPLKRIGKRGEGKWEEISWSQAMDEIADKLIEIQAKYGNESVAIWEAAAGAPPAHGLNYILGTRFTAAIRATNPINAYGLDCGAEFSLETDLGGAIAYMMTDPAWMIDSDLILVWGANPLENQQRVTNAIVEAKSRGAKVYDIGLVFDATAGYSDWFIPVKPGSDPALALALAKILVDEGLFNHEFMLNKTVAPLLVDTSTGKFLKDESSQFFWAWNTAVGEPFAVAPMTFDLDADTTALSGTYDVNGIECKTAFQLLVEHLEQYTPEFCEQVTGVPAQDCIDLAHALGRAKAIFYDIAYGMRYQNQGESHRAVTLLSALTGSNGYPGAGCGYSMVTSSWPIPFNTNNIMAPYGFTPRGTIEGINHVRLHDFEVQAKEGKYKAFLKFEGNPVHQCPNRARWVEDVFPNMELIVDFDIWMTDTGEMADYVLPDCMPFEREDIVNMGAYGHVVLQEPAIEPVGDNRSATYLFTELAKRMGLGEYFDKDEDGWIAQILADSPALTNEDGTPITIEQLHKQKMVRPAMFPQARYNAALTQEGFSTKSGRMEFYADDYAALGEAIAKYRPALHFPVPEGAEYPYLFFTGRQRFFMQSMFTEDPVMRELSGGKPCCRMNPADAEREGLAVGDKIEVYNEKGSVTLPLTVDEAVPLGVCHVWFGWRRRDYEKGTYSELTTRAGGEEACDELSEYWWGLACEKGLAPGTMFAIMAGSWDTLWDATCAVRKVENGRR